MGDPLPQLRQVLAKLDQLRSCLDYSKHPVLQPTRLEWENFLDHSLALSAQFRNLISAVPPEFRHVVVHPVKYEPPGSHSTRLLDLPPDSADQHRQEQLDELGLADTPPEEREAVVLGWIHTLNRACEAAAYAIQDLIDRNNLREEGRGPPRRPSPGNEHAAFLAHLAKGDGLPVPPDLRASA
jgi:hypothetical protein